MRDVSSKFRTFFYDHRDLTMEDKTVTEQNRTEQNRTELNLFDTIQYTLKIIINILLNNLYI